MYEYTWFSGFMCDCCCASSGRRFSTGVSAGSKWTEAADLECNTRLCAEVITDEAKGEDTDAQCTVSVSLEHISGAVEEEVDII